MRTEFCYGCAILLHGQEPLRRRYPTAARGIRVVAMQRRRGGVRRIMMASRRRSCDVDSRLINAAVVAILRLGRHAEQKGMCPRLCDPLLEAGPQRLTQFLLSASFFLGDAQGNGRVT